MVQKNKPYCILLATEIEKVRLTNMIIKIDKNGEYLTSVLNANATPLNNLF